MRESRRLDKLQKEIIKTKEKNLLAWDENLIGEDHGLKIVVLSNVFDSSVEHPDRFFVELEEDFMAEVLESVGDVQKIELFRTHPQGKLRNIAM